MSNIFCTFVSKFMIRTTTTYDYIRHAKVRRTWDGACVVSQRCMTLDFYYELYNLVLMFEPNKLRGYRERICYNEQILNHLPPP